MKCDFKITENSVLSAKKQEKIDKTFIDKSILTGDGIIQVDINALPTLMGTNPKTAKTKVFKEVTDKDKRQIDGKLYIAAKAVTGMLIDTRDNATTKSKEETCQRSLNNLNTVENLPEVQNQRTIAREIKNEVDENNKKESSDKEYYLLLFLF